MKFFIQKLGCPKNDVDADYLIARLQKDGHELVADPVIADSIIVNTCGFILPAKEESIGELLRLGKLKKQGRSKTLYAAGCLAQRNGDELLKGMPELDGAFGLGAFDELARALAGGSRSSETIKTDSSLLQYLDWESRYVADKLPYAYLKISDGCQRGCSYCAIPMIRGPYRSRPLESVLKEARELVRHGKKELILVSQDATRYGWSGNGNSKSSLLNLLKELDRIDGLEWIRVMYLHPEGLSTELVEYMSDRNNKTLDYFDIPLQHISDNLLAAMNRPINRLQIETLLNTIRRQAPGATLRTTFIVGFPGETQRQFEELKEFVADIGFDRLGAFSYSPEEGTAAAGLSGRVAEEVKLQRLDELMSLQQEIAFDKNISLIGQTMDIIIDTINGDRSAAGRSRADCPDIDQEVYITGDNLKVGAVRRLKIDAADGYDLRGTVIEG